MLKILPFILVIIVLYLSNSISNVESQNGGCEGNYYYYEETENVYYVNYQCYLDNQDGLWIWIPLENQPPLEDYGLEIQPPLEGYGLKVSKLQGGGWLEYDNPYEGKTYRINPNSFLEPYQLEEGLGIYLLYKPTSNFNGKAQFDYYYYATNYFEQFLLQQGIVEIKGVPYVIYGKFKETHRQFINELGLEKGRIEQSSDDESTPEPPWGKLGNRNFQEYIQEYENGIIYLKDNNMYLLFGDIFNKWSNFDLGYPVSNKTSVNQTLAVQYFPNGEIYHSKGKEPIMVDNEIYEKWKEYGKEKQLGYPISNEINNKTNNGWYQDFEKAIFYWEDYTSDASPIYKQNHEKLEFKKISEKWHKIGDIKGLLGFPVSNVKETIDKSNVVGFFQEFEKGEQKGAIYLVNGSANEVHGDIYEKWKDMGAENSYLGFPISDEFSINIIKGGKQSNFTNGILYWNPLNKEVLPMNYTNNK